MLPKWCDLCQRFVLGTDGALGPSLMDDVGDEMVRIKAHTLLADHGVPGLPPIQPDTVTEVPLWLAIRLAACDRCELLLPEWVHRNTLQVTTISLFHCPFLPLSFMPFSFFLVFYTVFIHRLLHCQITVDHYMYSVMCGCMLSDDLILRSLLVPFHHLLNS